VIVEWPSKEAPWFSMKAKIPHTAKAHDGAINEFFLVAGEDIAKAAQAVVSVGSHDAFERLQKIMGGLRNCRRRRKAEEIIAAGRVTLNEKCRGAGD